MNAEGQTAYARTVFLDETAPNGVRALGWEPGNGFRYLLVLTPLHELSDRAHALAGTTPRDWMVALVGGPGTTYRCAPMRFGFIHSVYLTEKFVLAFATADVLAEMLNEVLRPEG